jgi:hypothetical protein
MTVNVTGVKNGYTPPNNISAPTATAEARPAEVIRLASSIDHYTTWSVNQAAGYLSASPVSISAGATLFIEPGIIIKEE